VLDDLPYLVFRKCSYVTNILNKSFSDGVLHSQWLTALVTPVPKKT